MKTIKIMVIVLLLPAHLLMAQETVTLEQCQSWARENHPVLKQLEIYQQIMALKNDNNSTSYLPQLTLNGQSTWQSDVTQLPIKLPGMTAPLMSKDQ